MTPGLTSEEAEQEILEDFPNWRLPRNLPDSEKARKAAGLKIGWR